MKVLLISLAALALAVPAQAGTWPALDSLSSKVAGHPTEVWCPTQESWEADLFVQPGWLGYSIPTWNYAVLPPSVCGPLVLLVADPNEKTWIKGYAPFEAKSLFIFLHETSHLAGIADEHEADCSAARLLRPTLDQIGVTKTRRARLITRVALGYSSCLP